MESHLVIWPVSACKPLHHGVQVYKEVVEASLTIHTTDMQVIYKSHPKHQEASRPQREIAGRSGGFPLNTGSAKLPLINVTCLRII